METLALIRNKDSKGIEKELRKGGNFAYSVCVGNVCANDGGLVNVYINSIHLTRDGAHRELENIISENNSNIFSIDYNDANGRPERITFNNNYVREIALHQLYL